VEEIDKSFYDATKLLLAVFVKFYAKRIVKLSVLLIASEYLYYVFHIIYYHIVILVFTPRISSLSLAVKLILIEFKAI
jgi:hypothetical protein